MVRSSSTGTCCSPYRRAQRTSTPCSDTPCREDHHDAPGPSSCPYAPKCLEGKFSEVELPLLRILRPSSSRISTKSGSQPTGAPQRRRLSPPRSRDEQDPRQTPP